MVRRVRRGDGGWVGVSVCGEKKKRAWTYLRQHHRSRSPSHPGSGRRPPWGRPRAGHRHRRHLHMRQRLGWQRPTPRPGIVVDTRQHSALSSLLASLLKRALGGLKRCVRWHLPAQRRRARLQRPPCPSRRSIRQPDFPNHPSENSGGVIARSFAVVGGVFSSWAGKQSFSIHSPARRLRAQH